ncbi:TPA: MFS transporter [Raoultella ornithinolytica]|uniref:MFS transporter n=1 Tax=Raoultella ornithinolytica TaxID=54291 RepID=UPI00273F5232|nr:MFS transporter [Raoultella ornithinolytica]WLP44256.1 MFS transporter [Raoultella ornithinolytica]HEC2549988.1 MFS transporter [Raoultella ornithinolytica]HEC2602918.1 MFS transporter [Raoultella ornithinolytica]HEC2608429.1 MFS transporter [Raoultella ornithinolytica]
MCRLTRVHYAWYVAFACLAISSIRAGIGFQTMGFIINPAREELGWSNTQITGVIAFRELIAGDIAPLVGWLVDRRGPGIIIVVGAILVGFSLSVVSFTQTFWQFALIFGVIGGIGVAGLSNALVFPLIAKWFTTQRGRATGLVSSGANLGGILLSPVIIWLLSISDWRSTWFLLGFLPILFLVPLALFVLRREPADMNLLPLGEEQGSAFAQEKSGGERPDLTLTEAIRSPGFWCLIVGWNLSDFVLKGVLLHKVPAAESLGFTTAEAGSVILTYGAFAILGKLLTGFIVEQVSAKWVVLSLSVFQAIGLILFITAGNIWQLQLGYGVLSGLSAGGLIMMMPFLLASLFGRKNQGVIMGVVTPIVMISGIGGPLLAALLFDITGSYIFAFEIYAAIAVFGGLALLGACITPTNNTKSLNLYRR